MPKKSDNGVVTTQHQHVPPWMQAMRAAVDSSITADDLQEIVQAFVSKAKNGDEKAAKFVLDYLMGGKMQPQTVNIHQHAAPDTPPPRIDNEQSVADRVYCYVEASGAATPAKIARDLDLPLALAQSELSRDWYYRQADDRYRIARAGDRNGKAKK